VAAGVSGAAGGVRREHASSFVAGGRPAVACVRPVLNRTIRSAVGTALWGSCEIAVRCAAAAARVAGRLRGEVAGITDVPEEAGPRPAGGRSGAGALRVGRRARGQTPAVLLGAAAEP